MRRIVLVLAVLLALALLAWQFTRPANGPVDPGDRPGEAPVAEADDPGVIPPRAPGDGPPVPPDRELTGIVVDVDGRPVAEATVSAERAPLRRYRPLEIGVRGHGLMTSADGTFILGLWAGETVDLRVSKVGYATRLLPDRREGENLRIVLVRGATLDFVVTDEGGTGVPEANVLLIRRFPVGPPVVEERIVTGDAGTARLAGVSPGTLLVAAWAEGHGTARPDQVEVPGEGVREVKLVLPRGQDVVGVVRDATTGEPIAGATVAEHFSGLRSTTTDEAGRFELAAWSRAVAQRLFVAADGYADRAVEVPAEGELSIELTPGLAVSGRVVSADGEPVAGATIVVIGLAEGKKVDQRGTATAGPDGRFEVGWFAPDLWNGQARVQSPGHGVWIGSVTPGEDLGDIVLPAPRSISGLVFDRDGKPWPEAPVEARLPRYRISAETAYADDGGAFRFVGLPPGEWAVSLVEPGAAPATEKVLLSADADVTDIVLQPEASGELTVLVVDETGKPVAGMGVEVLDTSTRPLDVRPQGTGLHGKAVFRGLPDADVRISVRPSRFSLKKYSYMVTEPERPRGQTVRVVVKELAEISGVLLDEEGKALPGLHIGAVEPGSRQHYHLVATNAAGRFVLWVPVKKEVDLIVSGRKGEPWDSRFEMVPYTAVLPGVVAPSKGLTIRVKKIRTDLAMTVRVLDPDGKPMADMAVTPQTRTGGPRPAYTGADGRATFADLRDESYRVLTFPKDLGYVPGIVNPEPAEVAAGGEEVVLRCLRGVEFDGLFLDREGKPIEGGHVMLGIGDWHLSRARTGPGGRFRLTGLTGRRCELTANSPSMGWVKKEITIDRGSVEIRLGEK